MKRKNRTPAPENFSLAVYSVIRKIPRGKVASYGQVAVMAGRPRAARAVGRALRCLPDSMSEIPWFRVVNSAGRISEREFFWPHLQRKLLEEEGIRFDASGKVDLRRVGWFPTSA